MNQISLGCEMVALWGEKIGKVANSEGGAINNDEWKLRILDVVTKEGSHGYSSNCDWKRKKINWIDESETIEGDRINVGARIKDVRNKGEKWRKIAII